MFFDKVCANSWGETGALATGEPLSETAEPPLTPLPWLTPELAPPFGVIDIPAENTEVAAGSFGLGWALDDSGIAAIQVATELGPVTAQP